MAKSVLASKVLFSLLALILACGQALAVVAEDAPIGDTQAQQEQVQESPPEDTVSTDTSAGQSVVQSEDSEPKDTSSDDTTLTDEDEAPVDSSTDAEDSASDEAVAGADTVVVEEEASADIDTGDDAEDDEPVASQEKEAIEQGSDQETDAPLDVAGESAPGPMSVQSTLAQPSADQTLDVQAATFQVSNIVLSCDGMLSADVAAGAVGMVGYGISANMPDGSTPTVTYGTRTFSGAGGVISVTFSPLENALFYSGYLMDMATQTVIGETTSPDCGVTTSPATLTIISATCDGEVLVSATEGVPPGNEIRVHFYANGYHADGSVNIPYNLEHAQPFDGSEIYAFQFPVSGYPGDVDVFELTVSASFYDDNLNDYLQDVVQQPCSGGGQVNDGTLATLEIVDATCDGYALIRVDGGIDVNDTIYADVYEVQTNQDAVNFFDATDIAYTGSGEYEVTFPSNTFGPLGMTETFSARFTFIVRDGDTSVEATHVIPDCPNPWYVPDDVEHLSIEIVEATCGGQVAITMFDGAHDDHVVTASFAGTDADYVPIDGFFLEQSVNFTGNGDYEIQFDLGEIDAETLPESFFVGYGFLAFDGETIEAGKIAGPCAKADLLPSTDPLPTEDNGPQVAPDPTIEVDTPEPIVVEETTAPDAPEPVRLAVAAPAEAPSSSPASAPATAQSVSALPSAGAGVAASTTPMLWLVLGGLSLLSGALGVVVRQPRH